MLINEILEHIKEIKTEIRIRKERIEKLEEWIEYYKLDLKDKGFNDKEIEEMIE